MARPKKTESQTDTDSQSDTNQGSESLSLWLTVESYRRGSSMPTLLFDKALKVPKTLQGQSIPVVQKLVIEKFVNDQNKSSESKMRIEKLNFFPSSSQDVPDSTTAFASDSLNTYEFFVRTV